jgi:hypothetical protein
VIGIIRFIIDILTHDFFLVAIIRDCGEQIIMNLLFVHGIPWYNYNTYGSGLVTPSNSCCAKESCKDSGNASAIITMGEDTVAIVKFNDIHGFTWYN